MIEEIKITNFKSISDLTLSLGRVNVLIGSNGSGKSNILEAIAFGGAASADKLDNEFLGSRGIRTSNTQLTKCAFSKENFSKSIQLSFKSNTTITFNINEENKPITKWVVAEKETLKNTFGEIVEMITDKDFVSKEKFRALSDELKNEIIDVSKTYFHLVNTLTEHKGSNNIDAEMSHIFNDVINTNYQKSNYRDDLANFIIFSPENSSLRKFDEESQIKPLGVKGEGLFSILQLFYENEYYGGKTIDEIRKYLHIIEWFDDFEAIFDKVSGRQSLVVKDRNMPDVALNQNNVNEGFLFLLFYISLIISKETPSFFAIDNIEASFHPRLCEELIKILVELSKIHNKQIILTTHNPFVLDGLNLSDIEQKLFVVHRNADGETIADAVTEPIKNVKLSEAWMRGYIGGQPETIN